MTRGPHTHFDKLTPPDPTRHFISSGPEIPSWLFPMPAPVAPPSSHPEDSSDLLTLCPSILGSSQPLDGCPLLQTLGTAVGPDAGLLPADNPGCLGPFLGRNSRCNPSHGQTTCQCYPKDTPQGVLSTPLLRHRTFHAQGTAEHCTTVHLTQGSGPTPGPIFGQCCPILPQPPHSHVADQEFDTSPV